MLPHPTLFLVKLPKLQSTPEKPCQGLMNDINCPRLPTMKISDQFSTTPTV
jgi:hypothetical protein